MDRNPVLQDLHTYHNNPTSTTTTPVSTSQQQQQHQQQQQQNIPFHGRLFDNTQQNPNFLVEGIDFTHFDSRLFSPPQAQAQTQQQYMNLNTAGNMYPPQQQHNVLLQRYNSNGSTTSSSNSQPSYISTNYSPMAHYTATLQHQQDSFYYSQQHLQQLQQQLNTNTKKRKNANHNSNDLVTEPTQKKKPKTKRKRTKIVDPNAPKRNTGLNKPLILSPALSELMDGDKELSRPELVKKLWKYIKLNNLQDPADRRFILCDDQLKKIFNQDRINSFGMNKDLSAHLTKKQEQVPLQQQQEAATPSEDNKEDDDFLSFIKE